jgi:hypothetical protein
MTPFIPLLILTSLFEVFIEGMEYDDTFNKYFINEVTSRDVKDGIVLHPLNKYFMQ